MTPPRLPRARSRRRRSCWRRVVEPQADAEVDQGAAQLDAAFAADAAVAAAAGRLVLGRGQPGGPVELPAVRASGPGRRARRRSWRPARTPQPGTLVRVRERARRQQPGEVGLGGDDLARRGRRAGPGRRPGPAGRRRRRAVGSASRAAATSRSATRRTTCRPRGAAKPDEPGRRPARPAGPGRRSGRRPAGPTLVPSTSRQRQASARGRPGPAARAAGSSSRCGPRPGGCGAPTQAASFTQHLRPVA